MEAMSRPCAEPPTGVPALRFLADLIARTKEARWWHIAKSEANANSGPNQLADSGYSRPETGECLHPLRELVSATTSVAPDGHALKHGQRRKR